MRQAANAELAQGDTGSAIAALRHALELNANDPQAKAALDALKVKP